MRKCPDRSFVPQILNGGRNLDKNSRFLIIQILDEYFDGDYFRTLPPTWA